MKTTTQHWSGPNGCAEGCPACAEAERKTPLSEELEIILGAAVFQFDDEDGATDDGIELVREASEIVHSKEWAVYAAAPDLLTALYATLACMEESHEHEIATNHDGDGPSCSYCRVMDRARAALALATGGAK